MSSEIPSPSEKIAEFVVSDAVQDLVGEVDPNEFDAKIALMNQVDAGITELVPEAFGSHVLLIGKYLVPKDRTKIVSDIAVEEGVEFGLFNGVEVYIDPQGKPELHYKVRLPTVPMLRSPWHNAQSVLSATGNVRESRILFESETELRASESLAHIHEAIERTAEPEVLEERLRGWILSLQNDYVTVDQLIELQEIAMEMPDKSSTDDLIHCAEKLTFGAYEKGLKLRSELYIEKNDNNEWVIYEGGISIDTEEKPHLFMVSMVEDNQASRRLCLFFEGNGEPVFVPVNTIDELLFTEE